MCGGGGPVDPRGPIAIQKNQEFTFQKRGSSLRPRQLMIATRLKLLVRNKPLPAFIVIKHPLTTCVTTSYFRVFFFYLIEEMCSVFINQAHSFASKHLIVSSSWSTDEVPCRRFSKRFTVYQGESHSQSDQS